MGESNIKTPRCASCFFYVKPPTESQGHCRFWPPTVQFLQKVKTDPSGKAMLDLKTGGPQIVFVPQSIFPPVATSWWCGQYHPAREAVAAAKGPSMPIQGPETEQ